jgi:OFA family oxalate/formate antiporter-like MFS transporter
MSSVDLSVSQIKGKRIFYLIFATITLLVLGLIYAWSIFATPIIGDFPEYKPFSSQIFQVSMFAFCLSALAGAQIVKRVSAKVAIVVAAVLMAGGFVATAFGAGLGVWALFIFYGILAGSGCGIAYNAIISLVNPWFPDKIGLCSGIQMMGFGISALVFGSVANALFALDGWWWGTVFIIIAIVAFVIMLILAIIVKTAPKDIAQKLGLTGAAVATKESPTQQQNILTSKTFYLWCIWATIVIACGLTLIGTAKQGAELLQFDAGFAAILVGLVSTMNGLGRIINGAIFDKIGLIPVMAIAAAFAIATMAALSAAFALEIGTLYLVAAILVAFPYSAVPVMGSAYARQRFGAAGFAKNLGIANCNIATAAIINIVIVALLGSPASGNGPIIYGLLGVLAILAFAITFVFSGVYKKELDTIAQELE